MNNKIKEKVKEILSDYAVDGRSKSAIDRIIALLQPPQPSDEEIEGMARLYVKTLPALNYRSAYEFGTQNIAAWTKGFKQGLSYRSKEEWVSVETELPKSNKLVLAFDGKVFHLALYTKGHELNVDIDDDEYQSDEYEKLKGECYLKPGWYSQEEQSQSSYDFIYMNRDIVQWRELPPTDLLTTKQKEG